MSEAEIEQRARGAEALAAATLLKTRRALDANTMSTIALFDGDAITEFEGASRFRLPPSVRGHGKREVEVARRSRRVLVDFGY